MSYAYQARPRNLTDAARMICMQLNSARARFGNFETRTDAYTVKVDNHVSMELMRVFARWLPEWGRGIVTLWLFNETVKLSSPKPLAVFTGSREAKSTYPPFMIPCSAFFGKCAAAGFSCSELRSC